MRGQNRSARMWGGMVAGLCVLWFVAPAGAVSLESWEDKIPNANQRFKILTEFSGSAVLDKETQLVWERSPSTTSTNWASALGACISKNVGGRLGWRLPAIPELASLMDPSAAGPGPTLPPGHPFQNVSNGYWSATTISYLSTHAWFVIFLPGNLGGVSLDDKNNSIPSWCVRGPMQQSVY